MGTVSRTLAAAMAAFGVVGSLTVAIPAGAVGLHHHGWEIGRPPPPGAYGTVASVNGSSTPGTCGSAGGTGSFSLTTWQATVTVEVGGSTAFVQPGARAASFADVCVGSAVGAVGTSPSQGTLDATVVLLAPTPIATSGAFGTVASVNGSSTPGTCGTSAAAGSFVVTGRGGQMVTVQVSASTTFVQPGTPAASFADVCVGDLAGAVGTSSAGTLTATRVFVEPAEAPRPPFPSSGAIGLVTSVNGSSTPGTCGTSAAAGSFVVTGRGGQMVTVQVSASTTFVQPGTPAASFADVCVGSLAAAFGTTSQGALSATRVFVARSAPGSPSRPRGAFGTVASVNGSSTPGTCGTSAAAGSFVVTGRGGQMVTVQVSASTTFVQPETPAASFADVCVGSLAAAFGTTSQGALSATRVFVAPLLPPGHQSGHGERSGGGQ